MEESKDLTPSKSEEILYREAVGKGNGARGNSAQEEAQGQIWPSIAIAPPKASLRADLHLCSLRSATTL